MIKLLRRYCVRMVNKHEAVRFAIVGGIASLVNYAAYYVLLKCGLEYNIAFTAGYAVSFVFNFFASSYFTFRTRPNVNRALKFALCHLINFLMGLGVLNLLVWAGVPPVVAPIILVFIIFPVNFLFVRTSIKGFSSKKHKL